MTITHRFSAKLPTRLLSAVAVLAALGAMMIVSRDWAPHVGLAVYFSVAVLMPDGFGLLDAKASDIS